MADPNLAFIGGGNMAQAIVGGLIANGYSRDRITAADPAAQQRALVEERHGIRTVADNRLAVDGSDVLVLAVKPQMLGEVCRGIAIPVRNTHPLVLSVAAGVGLRDISRWLGERIPLIRVMPNSAALVGAGVTGMFANEHVDTAQKTVAERLMSAVGAVVWLDSESLLDPVTAVSGSGPAYFFLLMEIMEQVGMEMGLPADAARALTTQTAAGAAEMALQSGLDLVSLRRQVTSPGGTTEAALRTLEDANFRGIVRAALIAARDRGAELADTFGSD
jgi:pyrroline-5-carboxylate reductase